MAQLPAASPGPILAGDIGGTNTRLGLFTVRDGAAISLQRRDFVNRQYAGLAAIIGEFLRAQAARPVAACLGVAGPVDAGRCHLTNIDWRLDAAELARALEIGRVMLVNDLAAIAVGVAHLPADSFAILNPGTRPWGQGALAVVAPGTGLGEAATWWDGARHHPLPSEAGHADFAAVSEEELALLLHLQGRFGHVSWERVLSGAGIAAICDFLATARAMPVPAELRRTAEGERPAVITALALAGEPLCAAALDLYCAALAREAGNAALRHLALGGVALAGGISPRILPLLRRARFIDGFAGKGRFEGLLRQLPLRVVLADDAGLVGAAHLADVAVR